MLLGHLQQPGTRRQKHVILHSSELNQQYSDSLATVIFHEASVFRESLETAVQ